MKIDINKIKMVPKSLSKGFELCVFGTPDDEVTSWIVIHGFNVYTNGQYTNIVLPEDFKFSELFNEGKKFDWMDGFSPNLNKKLHIGHLSNMVLAKAFKSLGICDKTVSIYGDTLEGEIDSTLAFTLIKHYSNDFQFSPDRTFLASGISYKGSLLKDGTGEYEGTKIFEIGENKVVGIKSTGQTTYFYQDVALAETLNAPTLYLTGKEQESHFEMLKALFPHIEHIGLGLVSVSGKKMSSRLGNVILVEDFINLVSEEFNNDLKLIYNVFAGFILKSSPEVNKSINLDIISNPKNSGGLYLSYTMARLQSAGCVIGIEGDDFISRDLQFAELKARVSLKPNILFEALMEHCRIINSLYTTHTIRDNEVNTAMFSVFLSDLILGCKKLGLFTIEKV